MQIVNVDVLRMAMAGSVLIPSDEEYDAARSVWNGRIDRRPAVIAMCRSAADVAEAIRFGRQQGLEITVRGGGHNVGGSAICDDGLMINLREMRDVVVDPAARRVVAGGGATLAEMDAATQEHGLATTGGTVSHTGVGGLTLGGGMGWLTRKAGLTIDNLVSAEVVTADGRILRAAADENPDLFWAIRGGGGNLGVVTTFEFALHEVGPMVSFGLCFWGLEQGPAVLRLTEEINADAPRDLYALTTTMTAPPLPFVPESHHLKPGYAILVAGFGSEESHAAMVGRIRDALPPLFDFVTPIPYTMLQAIIDESYPWGSVAYEKGTYLEELSEGAIETLTQQVPRKPSPQSEILLFRLDGAYSEVDEDATAFGGARTPRYAVFMIGIAPGAQHFEANREWVRSTWQALQPHAAGIGGYINTQVEGSDADRVRATYGNKYDRLARIKATYDPDNVFHHNANIVPATAGSAAAAPAGQ
jgi:hypothetical protein